MVEKESIFGIAEVIKIKMNYSVLVIDFSIHFIEFIYPFYPIPFDSLIYLNPYILNIYEPNEGTREYFDIKCSYYKSL